MVLRFHDSGKGRQGGRLFSMLLVLVFSLLGCKGMETRNQPSQADDASAAVRRARQSDPDIPKRQKVAGESFLSSPEAQEISSHFDR